MEQPSAYLDAYHWHCIPLALHVRKGESARENSRAARRSVRYAMVYARMRMSQHALILGPMIQQYLDHQLTL